MITYLKNRLSERTTWVAIGAGLPLAAGLAPPWSYAAITVAIIGTLAPSSGPRNKQ